jgi:hemerythrin-like domain-containing protein
MADQQQRDVIEVLTHDHDEVREMFAQLEALMTSTAADEQVLQQKKDLVDKVTIELVRHSVAEEQYLYPAAKQVPGAAELVDEGEEEHSEAEKTMNALDKMSPDNMEFDAKVRELVAEIRHHIAEEEGDLFPRLRQHMDAAQLVELGGAVESAKKLAPTRPHPMSPDNPTLSKMLDPGAGIVDRIRDMITGRGKD